MRKEDRRAASATRSKTFFRPLALASSGVSNHRGRIRRLFPRQRIGRIQIEGYSADVCLFLREGRKTDSKNEPVAESLAHGFGLRVDVKLVIDDAADVIADCVGADVHT